MFAFVFKIDCRLVAAVGSGLAAAASINSVISEHVAVALMKAAEGRVD